MDSEIKMVLSRILPIKLFIIIIRNKVLIYQDCQVIHTCMSCHVMQYIRKYVRVGLSQWVARLTRNVEVVGSSPIKGPRCYLEQETLPLLLSTGWFQERIRA